MVPGMANTTMRRYGASADVGGSVAECALLVLEFGGPCFDAQAI